MTGKPKLKPHRTAKKNPNPEGQRRIIWDKYDRKMGEIIIKVGEKGGHLPAMCKAINVSSETTFRSYLEKYPEFAEAYETSKLYSQAFYEEMMLNLANGDVKGNASALALIMNNKFGHVYKHPTQRATQEINIGMINHNNLNLLNSDELDEKIKQLQCQLGIDTPRIIDSNAEENEDSSN